MSDPDLATLIATARERQGLSRRELARRAGVCPAFVNYLEAGERLPSPERLVRIAEEVGVNPERAERVATRDRRRRAAREEVQVSADLVAEVADEGDSEADLAAKLGVASDRGRRRVERVIGEMRRQLGLDPAQPDETKMKFKRAGSIADRWARRFGPPGVRKGQEWRKRQGAL